MRSMVYVGVGFGLAASGALRDIILGLRAKWVPILEAEASGTFRREDVAEADWAAWESGVVPLRIAWLSAMLDYGAVEPAGIPCPTLWVVGTENKDAMASVTEYRGGLDGTEVSVKLLEGLNHLQEFERVEVSLPVVEGFLVGSGTPGSSRERLRG